MMRELSREGGGFRDAVFTPAEIAWCEAALHPERRYAESFAAKEAIFKSLARCVGPAVAWQEIEVLPDDRGEPSVHLHAGTAHLAAAHGVAAVRVSLSHTAGVAAAFAFAVAIARV